MKKGTRSFVSSENWIEIPHAFGGGKMGPITHQLTAERFVVSKIGGSSSKCHLFTKEPQLSFLDTYPAIPWQMLIAVNERERLAGGYQAEVKLLGFKGRREEYNSSFCPSDFGNLLPDSFCLVQGEKFFTKKGEEIFFEYFSHNFRICREGEDLIIEVSPDAPEEVAINAGLPQLLVRSPIKALRHQYRYYSQYYLLGEDGDCIPFKI